MTKKLLSERKVDVTGKTHQIIGITAGLTAYLITADPVYMPATLGAVVVTTHIMALLPDIDQPASSLWKLIPFLGKYAGQLVNPFLEHRNLTHSFLGMALVSWLFLFITHHIPGYWGINGGAVFLAGITAYSSHLIADMVTVEGIPLLFPFGRMYGIPPRPFEGLRILTGKWFENLIIFPIANITFLVVIYHYWPVIKTIIFQA